jgi:hypothetical protein
MAHALRRDQAAVGDAAAIARRFRAEQQVPHRRVDAVGADRDIGACPRAVLELHVDAVAAVCESGELVADMDALGRQRGAEHRQQIAAMRLVIGKAEFGENGIAQRRLQDGASVLPAPLMKRQRAHAELCQRIAEAEVMNDARGVRADLDAGADFAQRAGLLVDMNVKTGV